MIRYGLAGLVCLMGGLLAAFLTGLIGALSFPPAPRDVALGRLEPGALRIVAFGSSLTASYNWPKALGPALSACRGGTTVEVQPIARPGAGSTWGMGAVDQVIAVAPDLVLMEFSINDADLRDGVSLSTARRQHAQILDRLAAELPKTKVLLLTMSPAYGLRGALRPWLAEHYELYPDLAAARGLGVLDLFARWRGVERAVFPDGLHPQEQMAAELILPPLLAALAGPDCRLY